MHRGQASAGSVYLVGAGPGDPELITQKALRVLRMADVIVYDHLANALFLDEAPPHCEKIYVGKCGRGERFPQEKINRLLVDHARLGQCVVRLKGGDPFIFGRGGEEAEVLHAEGIPFEVVPGVTSGIAAAAYAGIPLTHRELSSSVLFVSGHVAENGSAPTEWREIATHRGTIVIYMGVTHLKDISTALIEAGKSATTPVAVIEWGTLSKQRTVVAPLASIACESERAAMKPPALIVIGDVVSLRPSLAWIEKKPLFGQTVLLTRREATGHALAMALIQLGAEVRDFPVLESVPLSSPDDQSTLDDALNRLSSGLGYDWVLFTSARAVQSVFDRLRARGQDARAFRHASVAAVGEMTASALSQVGIHPDCVPSPDAQHQEGLLAALSLHGISGKRVWYPAAREKRTTLVNGLRALGATVDETAVYESKHCVISPDDVTNLLRARAPQGLSFDWVTFTSAATAMAFVDALGIETVSRLCRDGLKIACIGPVTRDAVVALSLPVHVVSKTASVVALAEAIAGYKK